MIQNELRLMQSFEEIKEFVTPILKENVPYQLSTPTAACNLMDFLGNLIGLLEIINRQIKADYGDKQLAYEATSMHAIELRRQAHIKGIICGYMDIQFVDITTGREACACGINVIPIENQGMVYFAPGLRLFITEEPKKGISFGEIKIGEALTIW
jgi:hypothetical protein